MSIKLLKTSIVACFIISTELESVSIVYNMRVAEITRRQAVDPKYTDPSITSLVLFDQTRKRCDSVNQNIAGGLATYLYSRKRFYCKADFAVGHVRSNNIDGTFSRTQTDDILLTFGYSKTISKKTKATVSLLLGFPTHRDTILEGIEFGTGHNGFGLQLDGSFICSKKENQSILAAARYIRFFPASIFYPINTKCTPFYLDIGNLVDLIIGYNYRFNTSAFEVGYNPSFLFSATITPAIATVTSQINGIRSSFYAAFKHLFLREKHPQGIIIAMSYGFDNKPKIFKRIITVWAAWGINF